MQSLKFQSKCLLGLRGFSTPPVNNKGPSFYMGVVTSLTLNPKPCD